MDKRYRFDDPYSSGNPPTLTEFVVVRKTPAGAWIVGSWAASQIMVKPLEQRSVKELRDEWGARFVLDGNGKRYAHESEQWARDSYRIRKTRQIQHARNAIERAEEALEWLATGQLPQPECFTFETLS